MIQYGPFVALDIATSDRLGAERRCREITGQSIAKYLEPISTSSVKIENKKESVLVNEGINNDTRKQSRAIWNIAMDNGIGRR